MHKDKSKVKINRKCIRIQGICLDSVFEPSVSVKRSYIVHLKLYWTDELTFNMGIPYLGKTAFILGQGPVRVFCVLFWFSNYHVTHVIQGWLHWYWGASEAALNYYDVVIMSAMASQITSLTIVYSSVYSGADQRKHQCPASLAFVRGIHRDRWFPRTKGQ